RARTPGPMRARAGWRGRTGEGGDGRRHTRRPGPGSGLRLAGGTSCGVIGSARGDLSTRVRRPAVLLPAGAESTCYQPPLVWLPVLAEDVFASIFAPAGVSASQLAPKSVRPSP